MGANHLPGGKDLTSLSRSLFSEAAYAGLGFGLGFSTTIDPAATLIPASAGDLSWGGAASTFFWVDPKEELIAILMTQLLPSSAYPIRRQLRTLVYSALTEFLRLRHGERPLTRRRHTPAGAHRGCVDGVTSARAGSSRGTPAGRSPRRSPAPGRR